LFFFVHLASGAASSRTDEQPSLPQIYTVFLVKEVARETRWGRNLQGGREQYPCQQAGARCLPHTGL